MSNHFIPTIKSLGFLLLLLCWSCQPAAQEQSKPSAKEDTALEPVILKGNESTKNLKKKLIELGKEINPASGQPLDRAVVVKFVHQAKALAAAFPKDFEVPKYLCTAAEYSRGINEVDEALALYGQVYQGYPEHSLAPSALFIQGFILENELNQKEKAIQNYKTFLEKYPNHEFAKTVKLTLEQSNMSPEELIKQFKQQKSGK